MNKDGNLTVIPSQKLEGKVTFSFLIRKGSGTDIAKKIVNYLRESKTKFSYEENSNTKIFIIEDVTVNVTYVRYEDRAIKIVARNYDSFAVNTVRNIVRIAMPYYVPSDQNVMLFEYTKIVYLKDDIANEHIEDCSYEESNNISFFEFSKKYWISKRSKTSKNMRYYESVKLRTSITKSSVEILPAVLKKVFEENNSFRERGREKLKVQLI